MFNVNGDSLLGPLIIGTSRNGPQAEYSYFSADFRLKIFFYYSLIIAYDISVLEYIGVSSIFSAGFSPCWHVLPFRGWNKLKTYNCMVFTVF